MSKIKQKLKELVYATPALKKTPVSFADSTEIRKKVNEVLALPVQEFFKSRHNLDMQHGIVYKLLSTNRERMANSVLVAHDVMHWARQNKLVHALWTLRLAKREEAVVARNQLLRHLMRQDKGALAKSTLEYTKKWGIKETPYSQITVARARSVNEARKQYAECGLAPKEKQILGNTLLQQIASENVEEVYLFYKSLNKDVLTFQIMLGAMLKNKELAKYLGEIWKTAERHAQAGNMKIDQKLQETYAIVHTHFKNNKSSHAPPKRERKPRSNHDESGSPQ